jgi:hypothetical protein
MEIGDHLWLHLFLNCSSFLTIVIARCAQRTVTIQPLDGIGAMGLSKRLDCFVARLLAMTVKRKGLLA